MVGKCFLALYFIIVLNICFERKELQDFWETDLPPESLTLLRSRLEKILKLEKSFRTRAPSVSGKSEELRPNSLLNKYRRVLEETVDFVKPENRAEPYSRLGSKREQGTTRITRTAINDKKGMMKKRTIGVWDLIYL